MKLFALCANSVKNHLMARDIVPAGQQCLPVQLRIVGKVQVVNRPALVTAEMRVGHCLCVNALTGNAIRRIAPSSAKKV